ncbi:MAG: GNAT family N-acetyltransferase [Lachnospiraceae bacterium]|nr:GNAT family N-acetyltransferase [Lachnospiraceae bacterium]
MLKRTMEYEALVDLFVRAGLEISPEDPRPEGLITCFELLDEKDGRRIGASGLCLSRGEYVLRCVAVEEGFRGMGYGTRLVRAVMDEAEQLGAERLWLTAKVPKFYEKFGFQVTPREEAPFVTKCVECPQYHNGCESEVMVLNMNKNVGKI